MREITMSEFQVGQWVRCSTWYDPEEVGRISQYGDGEYLIAYVDGEAYAATGSSLTPADPPPAAQPGEDGRVAEIRERVAKIANEAMFVKANYNQYYMVRGTHTGYVFADIPIMSTPGKPAKEQAEFIAAAPADIRYLLERLDAVTKRAERRRAALEPFARLYEEALPTRWANHASDSVIYACNDAELTLDDFKEAHRYARKESTDG